MRSRRMVIAGGLSALTFATAGGRDDFRADPRRLRRGLLDNGWRELAISSEHAVATLGLAAFHKDPFDRMLLAQAQVEGLALVTSDEVAARYPGCVRLV